MTIPQPHIPRPKFRAMLYGNWSAVLTSVLLLLVTIFILFTRLPVLGNENVIDIVENNITNFFNFVQTTDNELTPPALELGDPGFVETGQTGDNITNDDWIQFAALILMNLVFFAIGIVNSWFGHDSMANYRMIRAQLIRAESALAAKQSQLSSILKSYQDRKFRLIQDNLKRSFYIEYAKASNSSAEFLIAKSNIKEFHKLLALTINGKISSYARYFVDCLFEPSRLKKRSWLFGLSKISMEKELIISGDEHEKLSDLEQILQKGVTADTIPEANELNPLFNSSHFLGNRYEITARFCR